VQAIILRFVLLGPAIGDFVFVIINLFTKAYPLLSIDNMPHTSEEFGMLILAIGMVWLYGLMLAYPLGSLPALACGFIYWLILKKYTNRNFVQIQRIITGALIGSVFTTFFGSLFLTPQNNKTMAVMLTWAITGALSAGICAIHSTKP
jgi:hypothetical protein